MNKLFWLIMIMTIVISSGCNSDIVTTEQLRMLEYKCVYVAPLNSEDPQVGQVLRDTIQQELLRKRIAICDPNTATILITGSTFLTTRGTASSSGQSIESVSLVGKNISGEIILSASYDNKDRLSASKLAQEFGSALADKLR